MTSVLFKEGKRSNPFLRSLMEQARAAGIAEGEKGDAFPAWSSTAGPVRVELNVESAQDPSH